MAKHKRKNHVKKRPKAKEHSSGKENNVYGKLRVALRYALSSGWVQNSAIASLIAFAALIGAVMFSRGVKPAAITFGLIGTVAIWILIGFVIRYSPSETDFAGFLTPAGEPTPRNPCGTIPEGATLVLLGNSASYGTRFPQTIIKIAQDRMLIMDKIAGGITVSARLFSADGRIVAELRNNGFHINPNNFFRIERPDRHSLVVFDQNGVEVLNVRFINATTIRFLGLIRHPRRNVLISNRQGLFANTICSGDAGDAHFAFD